MYSITEKSRHFYVSSEFCIYRSKQNMEHILQYSRWKKQLVLVLVQEKQFICDNINFGKRKDILNVEL